MIMLMMAAILFPAYSLDPLLTTHVARWRSKPAAPTMSVSRWHPREGMASELDVSAAARSARLALLREKDARAERIIDKWAYSKGTERYLEKRGSLVGLGRDRLNSSTILDLDELNGVYPLFLSVDPSRKQMVYVDENRCIGCTFCAAIARQTFAMDQKKGTARVVQQGRRLAHIARCRSLSPVHTACRRLPAAV